MGLKADGQQSVFQIAAQLLGDGNAAHQLHVDGWDGQDPAFVPTEGTMVQVPGEKPGPPSAWLLDPKRWGRGQ